jgi:hypothetical protein
VQKDALMQVVKMRLRDERGVDSKSLLQMIESELTATSNLIVKKRAIEMLSKLSDFEEFQKNSALQENLLSGLI